MKKSFVILTALLLLLACGANNPERTLDNTTPTENTDDDDDDDDILIGEKFTPTADETARPGVGAYADYDIIPIRGEYVNSKNNLTPITFTSGEYVGYDGQTAASRKAFRMWFIIRKETQFSGQMTFVNLLDGGDYRLGSHMDEVANTLGEGSMLGAGNSKVAGNIMGTQGHFADNSDNELYNIYYTTWDIGTNRSIVYAGAGNYQVNFYIEPRTLSGNTGEDIPAGKIYTECPVTIKVVVGTGDDNGGDFEPEDYAGCTTKSFNYTSNNLALKVEVPNDSKQKTPFLIYVTGGSWTGGSVGAFEKQSKYLATRGIAGVRIVYSYVKNGGTLQLGYDEMKAAYDFVAARANELNLDVTRFGYVGGSAGCTIAAHATMTIPGCDLFVGCNGLYDMINLQANNFPARNEESMKYLEPYTQAELSAMSPIRVIPTTNTPAVALFHGTNDATINYLRSEELADAVEKAGGRAELYLYPGLGHGFFNSVDASSGRFKDVTKKMYEFARDVFGLPKE